MTDRSQAGPDGESRRFLLTSAVCRYPKAPRWDRPELTTDVERITTLFTGDFGYTHVPVLGLDPTKDQLLTELRAFCTSPQRTPGDYVVVYFAGHGEVREATGEHLLLTSDADPADLAFTALRTEELARVLIDETPLRRILLMLDTCDSGSGGAQVAARAVTTDPSWGDADRQRGFVVLSSTQPYQLATPGAFTHAFTEAVHSVATVGKVPDHLPLGAVVDVMHGRQDPETSTQRVVLDAVRLTGQLPAFLPNPRRSGTGDRIDAMLQLWTEQRALREEEFQQELLPKARAAFAYHPAGAADAISGWHFTGRREALRALTSWLTRQAGPVAGPGSVAPAPAERDDASPADTGSPALVVTGAPGSGKSALLGLVAALTHRQWNAAVPLKALDLPETAVPPPGSVTAAIYARGATEADVRAGIAAAVGTDARSTGALIEHLHHRSEPTTVIVDAVDEASDPVDLVNSLLRPLIARGHDTGLRLVIGARPFLLPLLTHRTTMEADPPSVSGGARVIDLDAAYSDPAAVHAHVVQGLRAAPPGSPFSAAPPQIVSGVADAVADAAGHSFLVARIITTTLVRAPHLPDPQDDAWRAGLPKVPGDAMRRDMEQRFGPDVDSARDLLLPLAYAEGQGLPWENVWAPLASHISGRPYTDDDIVRMRERAGSYILEYAVEGRSVYRLFHQALTEYVRGLRDAPEVHAAFTEVLTAAVAPLHWGERGDRPDPADGTNGATSEGSHGDPPVSRDWFRAHPYTRRHLAAHAAEANRLGPLVTDPYFLLAAAPAQLRRTLGALAPSSVHAPAASAFHAYSVRRQEGPRGELLSYLQLAARRNGAHALATAVERFETSTGVRLPWHALWATTVSWWKIRHVLPQPTALAMAATGDGGVVTVDDTGRVRVWDTTAETAQSTCTVEAGHCSLAILQNESVCVAAREDGIIVLRDTATGSPVEGRHSWNAPPPKGSRWAPGPVAALETADGRYVAWVHSKAPGWGALLLAEPFPFWEHAVQVAFEPHDGATGWSRTHRWRARSFHGVDLVEESPGLVVVVIADGVQTGGRIRAPLLRTQIWNPVTNRLRTLVPDPATNDAGSRRYYKLGHETRISALGTGCVQGGAVVAVGTQQDLVMAWHLAGDTMALDTKAPVLHRADPETHVRSVTALGVGVLLGRPVVIAGRDDGFVDVEPLDGGRPIGSSFFVGGRARVQSLAILPGDRVAIARAGGDVLVCEVQPSTSPHMSSLTALAVTGSAPGEAPLAHIADSSGRVTSVRLTTGETVALMDSARGVAALAPLGGKRPGRTPGRPPLEPAPETLGHQNPEGLAVIGPSGADRVLTWASRRVGQSGNVWHLAPTGYEPAGPDAEAYPAFLAQRLRRAVLHLRPATAAGRHLVATVTNRRLQLWDTARTASPVLSLSLRGKRATALAVGSHNGSPAVLLGTERGRVYLATTDQRALALQDQLKRPSTIHALAIREEHGACVMAAADHGGTVNIAVRPQGTAFTVQIGEPVLSLEIGEGLVVVVMTASGSTALRPGGIARDPTPPSGDAHE
ncbi:caspase family protein [Streptomyces sp. NPDC029041]|uniref:caspase family protein n=1 Tax=Streptomyces sp. NPDC029041 TaxID=3155727 RepID=UPI0033DD87A3